MIPTLKLWLDSEPRTYTGAELCPHYIYDHWGVEGDALVAFAGPANVATSEMVDLEDVRNDAPIQSSWMLHFLGEWFLDSLDQGILLQHFFMSEAYAVLLENGLNPVRKDGNDIYFQDRKLSVSIATRSPVSVLMHAGFNIRTEGTPIPTSGLDEMGVDWKIFAEEVLERFEYQLTTCRKARVKVRARLLSAEPNSTSPLRPLPTPPRTPTHH